MSQACCGKAQGTKAVPAIARHTFSHPQAERGSPDRSSQTMSDRGTVLRNQYL